MPQPDWLSWEFWPWAWAKYVANKDDIVPLATVLVQFATFVGAAIVAGAALAQAKTARRRHEAQTTADRERRITESFAKAVEQLGSDKQTATRLGGIYTLERISQEEESQREYWPIMETLTAFVRERSPAQNAEQEQKLATDIQAVMIVLGRRLKKHRERDRSEGRKLNLARTNLRGAQLTEAHLDQANLSGVILSDANLYMATLVEASLTEARLLDRAYLSEARLQKAKLNAAWLSEALLNGAHLEQAKLIQTHLEGAELRYAHFDGADLTGARLEGAELTGAKGLTKKQLNRARGDENTKLPECLRGWRPAHWSANAR